MMEFIIFLLLGIIVGAIFVLVNIFDKFGEVSRKLQVLLDIEYDKFKEPKKTKIDNISSRETTETTEIRPVPKTKKELYELVCKKFLERGFDVVGRSKTSETKYFPNEKNPAKIARIRVSMHPVIHEDAECAIFLAIGDLFKDADVAILSEDMIDECVNLTINMFEEWKIKNCNRNGIPKLDKNITKARTYKRKHG